MAFTKSLYYPWIEIKDESWLKSAALYWDHIQTIVPISITNPYSTQTAIELANSNILSPLYVESSFQEIEELTDDVVKYLESQEGMQLLLSTKRQRTYLHPDKLPHSLRKLSRLHPMKLSHELQYMLRETGLGSTSYNDFWEVDSEFAQFYMTLLATRLSEKIGAGLVTTSFLPHNLSIKAKLDGQLPSILKFNRDYEHEFHRRRMDHSIEVAQGMLVELIMENIKISQDTTIEQIIKFRENHSSELGRFRSKIGDLTSKIPNDSSVDAIRQYTNDLYLNEVKPAIEDLSKCLNSSKIKYFMEGSLKVAFISAGSSSLLVGLGLSTASALLAGAGLSLVTSGILYNIDRKESIRDNPYSYLIALNQI
jgi:hypothetical protein